MTATLFEAAAVSTPAKQPYFCDLCTSSRNVHATSCGALCKACRVLFAPLVEAADDLGELLPAPIYERVCRGDPEPEPDPEQKVGEGPPVDDQSPPPGDDENPREAVSYELDDVSASLHTSEKDETP